MNERFTKTFNFTELLSGAVLRGRYTCLSFANTVLAIVGQDLTSWAQFYYGDASPTAEQDQMNEVLVTIRQPAVTISEAASTAIRRSDTR